MISGLRTKRDNIIFDILWFIVDITYFDFIFARLKFKLVLKIKEYFFYFFLFFLIFLFFEFQFFKSYVKLYLRNLITHDFILNACSYDESSLDLILGLKRKFKRRTSLRHFSESTLKSTISWERPFNCIIYFWFLKVVPGGLNVIMMKKFAPMRFDFIERNQLPEVV